MFDSEVVIVGCGPIGGLMANLLGQRGIRTTVLERDTEIYQLPRAVGMDDEVMRVLQALEMESAYTQDVYTLRGMDLLRGNRHRLRRVNLERKDETLGYPLLTLFHQPTLERHIRTGLDRYPDCVRLRTGVQVNGIRDVGDSVEIDVVDSATGAEETIGARFVLGCDGGRSFVRSHFEIEQEDLDLHQPWVVVDAIMKRPIEISGYAEQMCDPARPGTFVPSPPPRNRWEFMVMPGDDPESMTRPETLKELIRPWASPEDYEVERAVIYTFHALIARKWRMGRRGNILLLGDAAHQMPPFLGQGMCAGVRDTFNLAWKLDLVLRGQADPQLLDSFQTERAEHVRKVIRLAVRIGKIIQSPSRMHSFFVNAMMILAERLRIDMPVRSTKTIPLGAGFYSANHGPSSMARCPFPQPMVTDSEGRTGRLDPHLGNGFALLSRVPVTGDSTKADFKSLITVLPVFGRESAARNGGSAALIDVDGVIGAWMDKRRCDAVLLRPDRQPYGLYDAQRVSASYILQDLKRGLQTDVESHATATAV